MPWLNKLSTKLGRITDKLAALHWPRKRAVSPDWDPQGTILGLKWLALGVLVVAVVVGWGPAQRQLSRYVSARRALGIRAEQVQLIGAPPWMPAGFKWRLQNLVAQHIDADPLDGRGLEDAVTLLRSVAWVRQVECVRRVPGGVEVLAQYRQPAALVEQRDGYRLVDVQGVRLPGLYLAEQVQRLRLPVILGAAPAALRDGQPWPGPGVPAALSLLRYLADQPYRSQAWAVEIASPDSQGQVRLSLLTQRGRVRWGLPPGQEQAIEPAAALKKQWLAQLYAQQGSVDAGGRIVEVYGPAVFVRDNLASDDTSGRPRYTWAQ